MFSFLGADTLGGRLREVAAPMDIVRGERVLAGARLFLAASSLLAIYLDPTEPRHYAIIAYSLMMAYLAYAAVVWGFIRARPMLAPWLPWVLHAIDLLWPATISIFSEGPNSPFFFFFFFVLLSAAFRWGFRQTLYTAGIAVSVVWIQAALMYGWTPFDIGIRADLDLNRIIMRSSYIAIMGFLLAYLGEQEKQFRAEQAVIATVLAQLRVDAGMREALRVITDTLFRLLGGAKVLLVATDTNTGQAFLWEFAPGEMRPRQQGIELDRDARGQYLPDLPGGVWCGTAGGAAQFVDPGGRRVRVGTLFAPPEFLASHPHRSVLSATFELGRQWLARLYLLDPAVRVGGSELQFVNSFVQHVGPAVYNVYLLRRLRHQGGAVERARVARELHDGAIQTLISAEMQIDVLRRTATGNGSVGEQLQHIQQLLRHEVLNLRELMQQMRPVDVTPKQLLEFLADTADRFQRDTGIRTQFVSELEGTADLPPRLCREVARVVQEALVNVRRHSGARNVVVRFSSTADAWKLVIDDDGQGFPFGGQYSLEQLDSARKGPLVIKERVRSLGGQLTVQSQPGAGARLEITIPHRGQTVHA